MHKEGSPRLIREGSGIELTLVGGIIVSVVWLCTHLFPAEATIEKHEGQIKNLDAKMDKVLENTDYIKGKIDEMAREQ